MYFKAMFDQGAIPVLEKMISFCEQRNRVLANNIANIDTPNYRRRDLDVAEFQSLLAGAIEQRGKNNPRVFQFEAGKNVAPSSLGGVSAQPVIQPPDSDNPIRLDGNNVNIDREMTELSKNALLHSAMTQILVKEFAMLQTAISEKVTR